MAAAAAAVAAGQSRESPPWELREPAHPSHQAPSRCLFPHPPQSIAIHRGIKVRTAPPNTQTQLTRRHVPFDSAVDAVLHFLGCAARYTVKLCTFNVNGKPPVRSSDDTGMTFVSFVPWYGGKITR